MVHTLVCHLLAKPEHVEDLKAELIKARSIYEKDEGTLDWHVMQDFHDPLKFSIVERFEKEESQEVHLSNPYWKSFDPTVIPWLQKPIELLRHNEL
ncbi:hypothetical protein JCM8547_006691 [Rhodosporidiobolus lusitaniae]